MSATRGCLEEPELAMLAGGVEPDPEQARHLEGCADCAARLAEARESERFVHRFASAFAASERDGPRPPVAAPTPELEGYRILEEVERGGQGVVYRALHEASGRTVALKVVRAGSYRRRARLEREARLAARLRHPNIVALHDCGELRDGRYALALELVDGVPLDAWSERIASEDGQRRDLVRRRLVLFERICDAVEHAHRHGVIHRDLKPDNILVDRDDEPRVLDFGIARGAEDSTGVERVTMTGEIACTIGYASPEQLTGETTSVDARTDVYSLGVILYELLAGRLPHDADLGLAEVLRRKSTVVAAPPSSLPPRAGFPPVDRDLDTIVLKALAVDPDRRYATAAALKADIGHALRGEPIDARRDSAVYLLRAAMRRHRSAILLASVAVLAILGGLAIAAVGAVRAREAALREEAERTRMLFEARRSEAVAEVLREVVPPGNPAPEGGSGGDAHRVIHSISANLEAGLFRDDPVATATTRLALGDICFDRGALRRAEVEYRQAVRALLERGDETIEDLLLASALERLARLVARRSGLEEAGSLADRATRIRARLLGPDHPDTVLARLLEAEVALGRGDLDEVDAALTALAPAIADDPRAAEIAAHLRLRAAARRGDRDAARAAAEERARICLRTFVDADHRVPDALADLARLRDGVEAETLTRVVAGLRTHQLAIAPPEVHEGLLAVKRSLLGDRDPDLVETLVRLGARLGESGRHDEAIVAYDEAIALAMPTGEYATVGEIDLAYERHMAAIRAGRAEEAVAPLARCVDALRPLLATTDPIHLATRQRELAGVYASIGDAPNARRRFAEALATIETVSPRGPHRAWTLIEGSFMELMLDDPARAVEHARAGIAGLVGTDDSWAWHRFEAEARLAVALARTGEAAHANEALARARAASAEMSDRARVDHRLRWATEELAKAGASAP